jgi:hypothetical protein
MGGKIDVSRTSHTSHAPGGLEAFGRIRGHLATLRKREVALLVVLETASAVTTQVLDWCCTKLEHWRVPVRVFI